jgi:hypothetical protein
MIGLEAERIGEIPFLGRSGFEVQEFPPEVEISGSE